MTLGFKDFKLLISMDNITNDLNNISLSKTTEISKRTLLILDLNGLLVYREYVKNLETIPKDAMKIGNFLVWKRPGIEDFIKMIFLHFDVAVWSSVSKYNIMELSKNIFEEFYDKLKFCWCQEECDITEHPLKSFKKLYKKNLEKVWETYTEYNETNTIIIDDTELKMVSNPPKCVMICQSWTKDDNYARLDIGQGIMRRLAYYILFR